MSGESVGSNEQGSSRCDAEFTEGPGRRLCAGRERTFASTLGWTVTDSSIAAIIAVRISDVNAED